MKRIGLTLCLFAAGCGMALETSVPSSRATRAVEKYGADRLVSDSRTLVDGKDSPRLSSFSVPQSDWPESIASMSPEAVEATESRVTAVLNDSGRWQNGVIIYLQIPPYVQEQYDKGGTYISGGSGYGEYRMEPGISWFWRKKR